MCLITYSRVRICGERCVIIINPSLVNNSATYATLLQPCFVEFTGKTLLTINNHPIQRSDKTSHSKLSCPCQYNRKDAARHFALYFNIRPHLVRLCPSLKYINAITQAPVASAISNKQFSARGVAETTCGGAHISFWCWFDCTLPSLQAIYIRMRTSRDQRSSQVCPNLTSAASPSCPRLSNLPYHRDTRPLFRVQFFSHSLEVICASLTS